MSEVKRFYAELAEENDYGGFVLASDFYRVTAERDGQITALKSGNEYAVRKCQELQALLTAADERADVLEGLLRKAPRGVPGFAEWEQKSVAALKQAEGGGDE